MKLVGSIAVLLIVAYWVTMNSLVIYRQREFAKQDRFRAGVTEFLGNELLRERWLEIYRKNVKIGYTGCTYEKVFAAEGVEIRCDLDSRLNLDIPGSKLSVKIEGSLVLDGEMKPRSLRLDVTLADKLPMTLLGEQRGDQFALKVRHADSTAPLLTLPREELILGDGLVPSLPVSGFRVGDRYRISCFDPVKLSRSPVEVQVLSKEVKEIDGLLTEVFRLETRFGDDTSPPGITSTSWMTASGELLRQEFGPPLQDIVLRRQTRANAKRFFNR